MNHTFWAEHCLIFLSNPTRYSIFNVTTEDLEEGSEDVEKPDNLDNMAEPIPPTPDTVQSSLLSAAATIA